MFKKLKEKITEEVKSSPQRFQQLTQSVSDRLQNSSTSDENFFSIGEDDANTSTASVEPGFSNVSLMSPQESRFRRNSSSSVASDVSFLPRYESFANMYHLQSDLDASASEIEDNASTSSQLGHLSKEQIYSAFQKAQMRYHKYRGRYTDLAKHYKDLERENTKMKSVLVETQDKAIRRCTELKEQCTLEQKAKAHLEGALRDEIDEKQFKIESLQTKIELLQNAPNSTQDSDNLENLNRYLNEARQEIEALNERLQEMKANSIIFQTREQEYKTKISGLEKEIASFAEREKENNLTLAQNKMELHNEMLSKDAEVSNLKREIDVLRQNLESLTTGNNKLENLQSQNKKLIEKLESLTQKCNTHESDLLKLEQCKIELHNANQSNSELKTRLKEAEESLETVREDAKRGLLSLEAKIRENLREEFVEKEEELRAEFAEKFEEVSANADDLQRIQLALIEKDDEIKRLREEKGVMSLELESKAAKYADLERDHLELIEDSVGLRNKIGNLEKELAVNQNESRLADLKAARLEATIKTLEQEIDDYSRKAGTSDELSTKLRDSEATNSKLNGNLEAIRSRFEAKEQEAEAIKVDLNDSRERQKRSDEEKAELMEKLRLSEAATGQVETELVAVKMTLGNLQQLNIKLCEDLEKRDANLELREKDVELKLEEEKAKLLEKLAETEEAVKNLEATSASLNEELTELKAKREEVEVLTEKLRNSEEQRERLLQALASHEERVKELSQKLEELEASLAEEKGTVERGHQEKSQLKLQMDNFEETIRALNEELSAAKEAVKESEKQIAILREDKLKLSSEIKEQTQLLQQKHDAEAKKREEEKEHLLEEVALLKKLLEEANNSLEIKEHELRRIETGASNEREKLEKLSKELENRSGIEAELSSKIEVHERDLKLKNQQIEALSKKLDEYNELIEERSEGFLRILGGSPGEPPNNFRRNADAKSLRNLEEKLRDFEQSFFVEKENLAKLLVHLGQFEERYAALQAEKSDLLAQIGDLQGKIGQLETSTTKSRNVEEELARSRDENAGLIELNLKLKQTVQELEGRVAQVVSDSNFLSEENQGLITELEEVKVNYSSAQQQIEKFEERVGDSLREKQQLAELEHHLSELQHEKQLLLDEIQELKITPLNIQNNKLDNLKILDNERYVKEIESLRDKLTQYKSLDLTNRSSIEFYENELQKLKNQNEKLNRKLDETLVTLNHCAELSNSTEIEYLRNVLYNYMLGKESLVLARVIAAVCKFDPHQTEMILAKEQQKQTLLGQLGIL